MRVLIAAPKNLLRTVHLENAIAQANIEAGELLLPKQNRGTTDLWLREWAKNQRISVQEFEDETDALKLLERSQNSAIVAVVCPDTPETLDLIAQAESRRIPVYVYRELYRQDPRVNCRFSPVERPDVWLKAINAEQRDFFRRLHSLCQQYKVELKTSATGDGGSFLQFTDGTQFEGIELDKNSCRVRPRGSFRYRKIPLD